MLLDEHGKEMRSVEFARWMEKKLVNVNKRLVFIIGGPYGFSQKIYDAAHEKISMSKMTFSHQMIRLIFVEQIYRAMTILNGGGKDWRRRESPYRTFRYDSLERQSCGLCRWH